MRPSVKKLIAGLPKKWQQDLKRWHFRRLIAKGLFDPGEPEYALLPFLLKEGDWTIDVGANVGQYTDAFSRLVGRHGRVIAFEPIPETLTLLSENVSHLPNQNVTLIGAAASNVTSLVGMDIPHSTSGVENLYEARITKAPAMLETLAIPIDQLEIPHAVRLIKVDAEGHDLQVLEGSRKLLSRDMPILIIEAADPRVNDLVSQLGYREFRLPNSPNRLFDSGNRVTAAMGRAGYDLPKDRG